MPTNNENGIRNFIAAASHSPYLKRALLLRNTNASIAQTTTTIVDCQR
jgi:hypothetical protein